MSEYFLGVDGGQSGTTAVIGDASGKILGWGSAGPCNHVAASEGRAKFLRVMQECLSQAASRAGLPQVGVLNSNLYSSLHPGYWVVFSGIYASQTQADAAKQAAGAKGFGTAYSRQITR